MKLGGFFIFLFVFAFQAESQNAPVAEYIIQINPKVGLVVFKEKLGLPIILEEVDKAFGIYSFKTDIAAEKLKLFLNKTGCVWAFQKNHTVASRGVLPNDPLLSQQKYLSIIKAADVWPYLHNGLSKKEDTLVVAIVDSGMDTMHPDLLPNRWINRQEIPHNQIDDDSNGYTDDYLGWNGGDTNSKTFTNVSFDGHGTAIAGIIGASGNNNMGISGINWNIKLMPVVCYGSKNNNGDIGVVRSLIYVYRMKQLYLRSGGKKGANIVVVNTSIGMDRTFAEEAPIWCALYDSLGAVGIISSAATSNSNISIDQFGDIPSTCASKFMIVVNSTDMQDVKANSGYSAKYIDMAAPGSRIYSTGLMQNLGGAGTYTDVSGTSFAAPQVAAAVALLYQSVCDTFWTMLKTNPDYALGLVKSWILTGTDALPSLIGQNASGGRLNMLNAWHNMDNWCRSFDRTYSDNQVLAASIAVYPNPVTAGQELMVEFQAQNDTRVEVSDMLGHVQTLEFESTGNNLLVQTTSLAPGNYFLLITTKNQRLVKKLQVY
ncbi:MAG: S8 family peptidase [Bacteroidia bacterium]|nr:S8 family peptidase [Bacteroidia bacterium]